jgi:hypothetical protein
MMTIDQIVDFVGLNRSYREVARMSHALSLHPWLNTPEETVRLAACAYALSNWKAYLEASSARRSRRGK